MLVGTPTSKRTTSRLILVCSGVFTYRFWAKISAGLADSDKSAVQKLRNNTKDLANVKIFAGDFFSFDLAKLPSDYKILLQYSVSFEPADIEGRTQKTSQQQFI